MSLLQAHQKSVIPQVTLPFLSFPFPFLPRQLTDFPQSRSVVGKSEAAGPEAKLGRKTKVGGVSHPGRA